MFNMIVLGKKDSIAFITSQAANKFQEVLAFERSILIWLEFHRMFLNYFLRQLLLQLHLVSCQHHSLKKKNIVRQRLTTYRQCSNVK